MNKNYKMDFLSGFSIVFLDFFRFWPILVYIFIPYWKIQSARSFGCTSKLSMCELEINYNVYRGYWVHKQLESQCLVRFAGYILHVECYFVCILYTGLVAYTYYCTIQVCLLLVRLTFYILHVEYCKIWSEQYCLYYLIWDLTF